MRGLTLSSLAAFVAAGLLSLPAAGSAQSLAEIAAKQKEKKKGKSTRVFTEDDLKKGTARGFTSGDSSEPTGESGSQPSAEGTAAPAAAEGAGAQAPQKSEDELRAERQTAWREKIQKARDNVTQLTAEVGRLEAALSDLTVPVYGATRTTRVEAHQKAKQQLAAAQQAVADMEEEGRRAGYR